MKKFTKNFLDGGHRRSLRILRSVALGLIALVWTQSVALAQECAPPDSTVYFKADSVDICYNDDNLYTVNISVMDFHNVDSFNLFLDYAQAYWSFEGFTLLEAADGVFDRTNTGPAPSSYQNYPLDIEDNPATGVLNIHWAEWVTRGDLPESMGEYVPIIELEFSLKNFPTNTLPEYINPLEWMTASSDVYTCGGADTFDPWSDVSFMDGAITADKLYDDIVFTVVPDTVDCADDRATVTVTSPVGAGFEYSFNGGSTWSTNPVATAQAGDHAIQVKDANGCLSVKEYFSVEAKDPLQFTTQVEHASCDNDGEITINPVGGNGTLTYWVVPDDVYVDGTDTYDSDYSSSTNQFLLPAGIYWSAVVDDCGLVGWTRDSIAAGQQFTYTISDDDQLTCYNGDDGEITVSALADGYPFSGTHYNVYIPGIVDTLVTNTVTISDLEEGTYEVTIADSVCSVTEIVEIINADEVTFYVDYTDAPCAAATGTLWVTVIDGDSIQTIDPTGWYLHVTGGGVDTVIAAADTLTGLSANYYSAWLTDSICPAVPFDNIDGSENNIPILDDGSITFDPVTTDEECYGDANGTIGVVDVLRTCENCNEGAVYQFSVDTMATWIPIDSIVPGYSAGDTVRIYVRDQADPDVCIVDKEAVVDGPDAPLQVTVTENSAPTCVDGNDGWVRMDVTGGTPPYLYSVDDSPNWRNYPSFGLTEGPHVYRIMDDSGCEITVLDTVETLSPILITASSVDTVDCYGEVNPISVTLDTFTYYSDFDDYTYYYAEEGGDPITGGTSFVTEEEAAASATLTASTFGAGTYYIAAKDPNGCYSNVDTVVIVDVEPLEVDDIIVENAECAETWSGRVTITVLGGNPDSTYYYALANNPDVYTNPNAVINWIPFVAGDTTVVEEVQAGEYWIAVQDACQTSNPQQAIVQGYEPIEVDGDEIDVENVSCNGEADGEIMIPATAVTGGAPGGYDGLGGEGAMGNYLYTVVHLGPDTIVGTELQESNMYSGLVAGDYRVYVYDTTDPDADPAQCAPDSADVEILQPDELLFTTELYHVSCADVEDGEIHISIEGGTGGNYDAEGWNPDDAEDDGNMYNVTINQIVGTGEYSYQLADDVDTIVVQVMGGQFEIEVTDANGCSAKDTVTIFEPDPWVITTIIEEPSDCNIEDGEIWAVVTGGFDTMEVGDVEVWVTYSYGGNTYDVAVDGDGFYAGDTILVTDSAIYDEAYTIEVGTVESDLTAEGIMLINETCDGSYTETIEVYNPFVFDVTPECATCYGSSNGKVTISNITGGVGPYQVQLVGGDNPAYDALNEDLWWPKTASGANDYETTIVFDTLAAGTYYVYLRDTSGFTLANCCRPEEFVICQPDTLILESVTLVSNVDCYGDSTGAISIQASGGSGDYEYSYTRTEVGDNGHPYQGIIPDDAMWYPDSIITGLPIGTYIGWVRDANAPDCVTGCEINSQGFPIDEHRTVVQQAGMVMVDSVAIEEPMCYEGLANVELWGVNGGTGDSVTFKLAGKTYAGMDTTYMFGPLAYTAGNDYILEDVYASDTSGYVLTLATEFDCESEGDTIMVTQPDVFSVEAMITSGGICAGDAQAAIEIDVEGGVAPYTYTIYADGTPVPGRIDVTNVNHVLALGAMYVIEATDDLGCVQTDTLRLDIIEEVTFTVDNITCFDDTLASARIVASGTPGRMFTVSYRNIENGSAWVDVPTMFSDTIEFDQIFEYDAQNLDDVHYAFEIFDEAGCSSGVDTLTFDIVQNPVAWDEVIVGESVGCEAPVEVSVTGGIPPYTLYVDGEAQVGMTVTLTSGTYEIKVMDSHECYVVETVNISCPLTIAEVQSMKETSDYVGDVVQIEGTVSAVADGGFYVQDDNAAWSGIWVASDSIVAIGDGVTVAGIVDEIDDVTTITSATVTVGTATLTVAAIEVLPEDIEDEMYESVLVVVVGVRANAATDGIWTAYTEETIIVTIDTLMYTANPVEGHFYTVTGIVNGMDSMYYVEPRMESDVVDNSINIIEQPTLEFKVYPNPFNDRINIDNNEKLTRVIISNIAGQRVIDIEYPSHEIRTANLVSGVYLVRMFTEEGNTKTVTMIKR